MYDDTSGHLARIAQAFEKSADWARSKAVHDSRYAHGLEKETWEQAHMPHYNGEIVPADKVVVGKGGNTALMDRDVLDRTTREMAEYAKENPWSFWGAYPAAVGGAALAGAAAAAPAATAAAVGTGLRAAGTATKAVGRGAATAGKFVANPLYQLGFPKWVGPATASTGLISTLGMASLPPETAEKIPEGIRRGMSDLMLFDPLRGGAAYLGLGAAGAAPGTWMPLARNMFENFRDGRVAVPGTAIGRVARAGGEAALDYAEDEVKRRAEDLGERWFGAVTNTFGDVIQQGKQFVQDKAMPVVDQVAGAINQGLDYTKMGADEIADLLNKGTAKWEEIPEPIREYVMSTAADKLKNAAIEQILSFKYPDFDMSDVVEDVNDFNNRIVLPTKEMFAGEPGKDYDASNYRPDFVKDLGIEQHSDLFMPAYGWSTTSDLRNKVHMNKPPLKRILEQFPDAIQSILAHEADHEQNNDSPAFGIGRAHSGVSKDEQAKLDAAYDFTSDVMKKFYPGLGRKARARAGQMEAHTSNREFRKALDRMFQEKLGRKPTAAEYLDAFDAMTDEQLEDFRHNGGVFNGYIQDWIDRHPKLDREQMRKWRKALREVAQSGGGTAGVLA